MAYSSITLFILLLPLFTHAYHSCPQYVNYSCPDFHGNSVMFPFTNSYQPDCGLCVLKCENNTSTTFKCGQQGLSYKTKAIFPDNNTVVLEYPGLHDHLSHVCQAHQTDSVTIPDPPHTSFKILNLVVFFRCSIENGVPPTLQVPSKTCDDDFIYGPYPTDNIPDGLPPNCSEIKLPNSTDDSYSIVYQLPGGPGECVQCASDRGRCIDQTTKEFHCPKKGNHKLVIFILSSVLTLTGCVLIILALIMWRRNRKIKPRSSTLASGLVSFSGTRSDLEEGMLNGVTVFSYNELEEATNKFDPTKELGEGGFGIVYHGKLRDGREVAVKRLFENNYKRIEQFKNEIKILTSLRHKNLVTLYGCTSRHSRELLLVYEYIANGTVADHLFGDHPKSQSITWSTRMNIALETAEALSYLHKKEIIHRDVKTNNILLDSNFSVKVADFGMSRLFPADVTHVSTAPQGTPGYLDPEYHQFYHLTDRSDVYSFGVVLIELISSLPAVDVGRHRHEINLSNYAINKIQSCAFDELVDPDLGFETDPKVRRMTISVAELAFQCLQHERDLRPSMEEVVHALTRIMSLDYDALEEEEEMGMGVENKEAIKPLNSSTNSDDIEFVRNAQRRPSSSPEPVIEKLFSQCMKATPSLKDNNRLKLLRISLKQPKQDSPTENDDVGMLKNVHPLPTSPASVMDKWSSQSSTPNTNTSG